MTRLRVHPLFAGLLWSFLSSFGLACSDDQPASTTVACRQKANADTDSDCAYAVGGRTRKLDCDTAAQTSEALAAGCVRQSPTDNDVCCPRSVRGMAEVSLSGCTEPADTLTDTDCAGTTNPRKLDCTTATQQRSGIALGCRPENPSRASDFDLCCPTHVRGR